MVVDEALIDPWLKGGDARSPVVPAVAQYLDMNLSESPVLDAGSGSGGLLKILKDQYHWSERFLYGCDIEQGHTELARENCGIKTIVRYDFAEDNEEPIFPSVQFGAVVAVGWLHNDWKQKYYLCKEKTKSKDQEMINKFLDNVENCTHKGSLLICNCNSEPKEWLVDAPQQIIEKTVLRGFSMINIISGGDRGSAWVFKRDY